MYVWLYIRCVTSDHQARSSPFPLPFAFCLVLVWLGGGGGGGGGVSFFHNVGLRAALLWLLLPSNWYGLIIIIIIIAFRGAIQDFWQSSHCPANCLQHVRSSGPPNCVQITCNTSSAYHVQHVLRVTWYKGTAQLLSLTEFKSHVFELYFIGWTI